MVNGVSGNSQPAKAQEKKEPKEAEKPQERQVRLEQEPDTFQSSTRNTETTPEPQRTGLLQNLRNIKLPDLRPGFLKPKPDAWVEKEVENAESLSNSRNETETPRLVAEAISNLEGKNPAQANEVRAAYAANLSNLPEEKKEDVYNIIKNSVDYSDPKSANLAIGGLARGISAIPEDKRKAELDELFNAIDGSYPDTANKARAGIGSAVFYLPEAEKSAHFNKVADSIDPTDPKSANNARSSLAWNLTELPQNDKPDAFNKLLGSVQTENPASSNELLADLAHRMNDALTDPNQKLEAFNTIRSKVNYDYKELSEENSHVYPHEEVFETLAANIEGLPEQSKTEAFNTLFADVQSNDLNFRSKSPLAASIRHLPEADRLNAIEKTLNILDETDSSARQHLASIITDYLPENQIAPTFNKFLDSLPEKSLDSSTGEFIAGKVAELTPDQITECLPQLLKTFENHPDQIASLIEKTQDIDPQQAMQIFDSVHEAMPENGKVLSYFARTIFHNEDFPEDKKLEYFDKLPLNAETIDQTAFALEALPESERKERFDRMLNHLLENNSDGDKRLRNTPDNNDTYWHHDYAKVALVKQIPNLPEEYRAEAFDTILESIQGQGYLLKCDVKEALSEPDVIDSLPLDLQNEYYDKLPGDIPIMWY